MRLSYSCYFFTSKNSKNDIEIAVLEDLYSKYHTIVNKWLGKSAKEGESLRRGEEKGRGQKDQAFLFNYPNLTHVQKKICSVPLYKED